MSRLPKGCFYHLARFDDDIPENDRVQFQTFLSGVDGEASSIGFFSRRDLAQEHCLSIPEKDWKILRVSRDEILEFPECNYSVGITRAIMDPPVGYRGAGEPLFSILVESL
jgi:hypothetical protein